MINEVLSNQFFRKIIKPVNTYMSVEVKEHGQCQKQKSFLQTGVMHCHKQLSVPDKAVIDR